MLFYFDTGIKRSYSFGGEAGRSNDAVVQTVGSQWLHHLLSGEYLVSPIPQFISFLSYKF
jgi:hypothetical protein